MPIVGNPLSGDGKGISTYFISSWEDLKKGVVLSFWFEEESDGGRLCGAEIQGNRVFGVKSQRGDDVVIEEGRWIEGLVLTITGGTENALKDVKIGITGVEVILDDGTRIEVETQTGDKRLLKVNGGMILTGLIGKLSNGFVTRLGLLQAPNPKSTSIIPPSKTISPTLKPLWHTSLPPPHLYASPYETGYWTPDRSYDTIPMSFILFSPTGSYDQLSSLRGVESDPNMRCWGVTFRDGDGDGGKRTGPQDKMDDVKMFAVDGERGERVIKVEIGMNHLVQGVKITTNKNRFAFFGPTQKNYHSLFEETETAFITGLYVSWGYSEKRRECSTISVLSAAKPGHDAKKGRIDGVMDRTEWTPERNPRHLVGPDEFIALVDESEYEAYKDRHW